jgi:ADP-ribose pyrophosphatase YjhB (NUDIX family)
MSYAVDTMHWIQKHVLRELITHEDRRYADIKPPDIEGNLFMYHLWQLIRSGLVEKLPSGRYCLTAGGKREIDQLALKTLKPRIQPRIITLMAVENNDGRWLFYRRSRQPLINLVGWPYGKIMRGQSIKSAAESQLASKTGVKAELEHRGDGYATTYENGQPVSEIMFHAFYGRAVGGDLINESSRGQAFWSHKEDLKLGEFMPNVLDLHDLVMAASAERRFFAQLEHHL